MDKQHLYDLYQQCLNIDLGTLMDIINETTNEDERSFYVKLYNYVLQSREKVLVADGVY